MNMQNNDLISRKEVLERIQPQLNSARVGSLEYQRLYSIQLSVEKLKAVSQTTDLRTAEQTCEVTKACVLRVFQSLDKHPYYTRTEDTHSVQTLQVVQVYELLRALMLELPKNTHLVLSEYLIDEWGLTGHISEQEFLNALSDIDLLKEHTQEEEFEQER